MDYLKELDTLGRRIKYIRMSKGLNQGDFAKTMDVETNIAVSRWETDKAIPSLDTLIKMSEVGKVTLDWLIKGGSTELALMSVKDNGLDYKTKIDELAELNKKLQNELDALERVLLKKLNNQ